jgi:CRP-like cAMP-binding protein
MQKTSAVESRLHTFAPHDLLPLQQDAFWLVKQGAVKTFTWNEDGSVITLGYWGSGDVIGQPLSQVSPYQVQCLTYVEASCVPWHQCNWLSDAFRRHIQQTEELLCIVRSERMHQRLLKILNWMAVKFGRSVDQGRLIEIPLTHQELAEVIGTTRVTVTRLINLFEQDGVISRPRRNFIVLHSKSFQESEQSDRAKDN